LISFRNSVIIQHPLKWFHIINLLQSIVKKYSMTIENEQRKDG
jgi:hypothetical protein